MNDGITPRPLIRDDETPVKPCADRNCAHADLVHWHAPLDNMPLLTAPSVRRDDETHNVGEHHEPSCAKIRAGTYADCDCDPTLCKFCGNSLAKHPMQWTGLSGRNYSCGGKSAPEQAPTPLIPEPAATKPSEIPARVFCCPMCDRTTVPNDGDVCSTCIAKSAVETPTLALYYCDMCGRTKMLPPIDDSSYRTCGEPTGEVSMSGVLGLPLHCGGWMLREGSNQRGKRGKMEGEVVTDSAVPAGEVHAIQGDKLVGKIVNIGRDDEPPTEPLPCPRPP